MRKPAFRHLATDLLRGGVAPRHVARTVLELQDHYEDLVDEACSSGLDANAARRLAIRTLGSRRCIAAAVLEHAELKCWWARHPLLAGFASLPAAPLTYCACRGPLIARWGASVGLGVLVTSALLLSMQAIVAYP